MTIVTNKWPPMALGKQATQNEEIGFADLPQTIAGNAATMKGHVAGGSVVVDAPNPAPLNPSGDYGHDHSGGSMGRPFYKSIATISFDDLGVYNQSKWSGSSGDTAPDLLNIAADANSNNFNQPLRLEPEAGQPGETTYTEGKGEFQIWVPPCDLQRGAYLNCGFSLTFAYSPQSFWTVTSPGTPIIGADEIFIYLRNLHPQAQPADPNVTGFRYAGVVGPVVAPQNEEIKFLKTTQGEMVLFPGQINPMQWRVKQVLDAGGGGVRACFIQPLHLEIGVFDASSS